MQGVHVDIIESILYQARRRGGSGDLSTGGQEPKEQGSERASEAQRRETIQCLDICRIWQVIWDYRNRKHRGSLKIPADRDDVEGHIFWLLAYIFYEPLKALLKKRNIVRNDFSIGISGGHVTNGSETRETNSRGKSFRPENMKASNNTMNRGIYRRKD